jgi:hypothetical protein
MLLHDETHWWYRGAPPDRAWVRPAPRITGWLLDPRCGLRLRSHHARPGATRHRLGRRQRPDRGAVRAGQSGAAGPAGERRAPPLAPAELRPRHLPRRHRAPRRRRRRPARAAPGDGSRRRAARHRPGVRAPLVAPRRGQRPPAALCRRIAAHGAGGGRLARGRRHLLQLGAAAAGGACACCHPAAALPWSLGPGDDARAPSPRARGPPPARGGAARARHAPPGRLVAAVRLPAAYPDAACWTVRARSGAP